MAAPEAADEMDMDADAAPAQPHPALLRSRLSGDVRERIGLKRMPEPTELLCLPDPGRPAARNCFDLARAGTFAMRAAAASALAERTPVEDADAPVSGAAVPAGRDGDADGAAAPMESDVDGDEADGSQPCSPEVQAFKELRARLARQVDLLATNPVLELAEDQVTLRVKKDKYGSPMVNNRLNARHFRTMASLLGEPEENPGENAALLQLLAAAVCCPCDKAGCSQQCEALPCTEHAPGGRAGWTRGMGGNALFRSAKWRLAAVLPTKRTGRKGTRLTAPHHESIAGWVMNAITTAGERLKSFQPFVRNLGAAALAAYGPAAFPCGMLSLWDPCVAFIAGMLVEDDYAPLLQNLAVMAAEEAQEHLADAGRHMTPAVASEKLAANLLALLHDRLVAVSELNLDPAQAALAKAGVHTFTHGDAGPGAGKTHTMVARLAYLYLKGATPNCVIMLTFTNKAVGELKSRVVKLGLPVPPHILTLDSFIPSLLSQIVREAGELQIMQLAKDDAEAAAMGDTSKAGEDRWTMTHVVLKALQRTLQLNNNELIKDVKHCTALLTDELLKEMQRAGGYWSTADDALLKSVAKAALEQGARSWKPAMKDIACTELRLLTKLGRNNTYGATDGNLDGLVTTMKTHMRDIISECECRDNASPCHVLCKFEAVQLAAFLAARACRGVEPSDVSQPPPPWAVTTRMVAAAKEVIKRSQPSYYILDELQDTDVGQFQLLAHLSKFGAAPNESRLTAVGDYDQAIYGFRGAFPEALRDQMSRLFPNTAPVRLENNYRSTPAIVAACRAIVAPNYVGSAETPKDLKAHRATGLPVQLVECGSMDAEYQRIAEEIDAWCACGVAIGIKAPGKGDGMAVLFLRKADVEFFADFMRTRWVHDPLKKVVTCRDDSGDSSASSSQGERDAPGDALYVSTIHAAKGTEYEIVFLAGLGEIKGDFRQTWVGSLKWSVKCSAPVGQAAVVQENRRVQFVGASRPRSLLHVSYAGAADGWCEAVANLKAALGRQRSLLEQPCCRNAADAKLLAAAFAPQRTCAALMGAEAAARAEERLAPGAEEREE